MTNSLRFAIVTALKATLDLHKIMGMPVHPLVELDKLFDSLQSTLTHDDITYFMDVIYRNEM